MATKARRTLNAVVVSAGLMNKTVKVRLGTQNWNSHIRKHFKAPKDVLVHDPRSSLRLGDVIAIESGWRVTRNVRHVVSKIIAPYGEPIEARPPVLSYEERLQEREQKTADKMKRREARREEREARREMESEMERMMATKLEAGAGDGEGDVAAAKEAREAEVS